VPPGIVESTELVATDDEHDPEGHTIAFERQQVAGLLRAANARLAGLDAALERVEEGIYGTCATCGGPIADERLEVMPGTLHCIECVQHVHLSPLMVGRVPGECLPFR
jgi:DnaK suppressor protein